MPSSHRTQSTTNIVQSIVFPFSQETVRALVPRPKSTEIFSDKAILDGLKPFVCSLEYTTGL
jgi:hypothetical protein